VAPLILLDDGGPWLKDHVSDVLMERHIVLQAMMEIRAPSPDRANGLSAREFDRFGRCRSDRFEICSETATGYQHQSNDLARGAGPIHDSSNLLPSKRFPISAVLRLFPPMAAK
jgi:hypothetical protein